MDFAPLLSRLRFAASLTAFGLVAVSTLSAQSVGDRLKQKVKERADATAERAMDKAIDKAEGLVNCLVGDEECVEKAKTEGKQVKTHDLQEEVDAANEKAAKAAAKEAAAKAAAAKEAAAKEPAAKEPAAKEPAAKEPTPAPAVDNTSWANFDFVPGERVLFAEDFSRDRVGNFPQRLELVSGNMEVIEWRSKRWLRVSSVGALGIPLPEKLGTRFTMEFDATIPWNGLGFYAAAAADKLGPLPATRSSATVHLSGTLAGVARANSTEGSLLDPRTLFADMFEPVNSTGSRVFHVRMEADGRYVKVYLDEKRIANIPNADFGRANKIFIEYEGPMDDVFPVIGNISVNAGGKKLYDALLADGRVSTQGILFDVGSDRIRGESTPTLKLIGDMLAEHPELKLAVEGHTDNTGTAAANQTLSQKRAQAIVAYLTATFHVDAARLTPKGMGQTKPVGTNDTPEGRQANRRVELVRIQP